MSSPEAVRDLEKSIPLYMGPHCTKVVDSSTFRMFSKRNQHMDTATLQYILDMVEAVAETAFQPEGAPSQVERLLEDPRQVWMEKHNPSEKCVGIMGQTKTMRVPITITMRRMQPHRNCQTELMQILTEVRERQISGNLREDDGLLSGLTDCILSFLSFSFEESMSLVCDVLNEKDSMTRGALEKCTLSLIPSFKAAFFKNGEFVYDPDCTIACTCFVAVALLEHMSSTITPNTCRRDGGLPYRAHVFMQCYVPLVYAMQTRGVEDKQLSHVENLEELYYPRPQMVCWAPELFDLTNILDSSGFFIKMRNQQQMSQRHDKTQKAADEVLEQLWNGTAPLTSEGIEKIMLSMQASHYALCRLFQKAQPMRCQVRQMIDVCEKMCLRDSSIYNVVIMFFHTSVLGGYAHCRVRPSFVSLFYLYRELFIEPTPAEDIFSWFKEDRTGQTPQFAAPPFEDWRFKEWNLGEQVANSFSVTYTAGADGKSATGSKKNKSEVCNYQRMFMYFLREAMWYYTSFVPALETLMRRGKKYDEMQKNMLVLTDMIRHTVDHGIMLRYKEAARMHDDKTPFVECFNACGPKDPFSPIIPMLTGTRAHKYVVHIPTVPFEETVCEACDKIDNGRRSTIVSINFNYSGIDEARLEEALSWGIVTEKDPRTGADIYTYAPDYLEYKSPGIMKRLEMLSVFVKTCTGPPNMPKCDTALIAAGINPLLIRELREARINHPRQSVLNALKKILSGLNVVVYTIVRFFFKLVVKLATFNRIYMLPKDVILKTDEALRRKHHLPHTHPITPAMSTMMFCPSCEKMKSALADVNPRNVTGFGNGKVMVNPRTMKVYCATKKRKQTTSVITNTQEFLSSCFGEPDPAQHLTKTVAHVAGRTLVMREQDPQNKAFTKRRPENVFTESVAKQLRSKLTSCAKAREKSDQHARCQSTEQLAIPLRGVQMMYKGNTYTLCMECGSKMSLTRASFRGDGYTCGNCTKFKQEMDAVICAYCTTTTLRDTIYIQQEVGPKGYKERRPWGEYSVLDDTAIVNAEMRYDHIHPPRTHILAEEQANKPIGMVIQIHLCPKCNKPWIEMESKTQIMKWSRIRTGLSSMFYLKELSSGEMVVLAPDEKYRMSQMLNARAKH